MVSDCTIVNVHGFVSKFSVGLPNFRHDINRERKGIGSAKLVGWKSITRVTREPIFCPFDSNKRQEAMISVGKYRIRLLYHVTNNDRWL